jgi:glycosyltransferase involved in cell wall biosynthesis
LDKLILKKVSRHIDKLFAVSEFLKQDLQIDFPTKNIEILPNHIDTKTFIPNVRNVNEKKQFLHISTLDEKVKNPKGIIDASILLIKKGILNFHLTIISDESNEKWEAYSVKNNIAEYITFLGPLDWFELVPYYQKSDAFILFSSYETFSIVLAEAWACGIPTLTTPVGIGVNLFEDLGIQIEINSPESLVNGMIEIIENKISFNPLLISKHAEQFSGENVLRIFKELAD